MLTAEWRKAIEGYLTHERAGGKRTSTSAARRQHLEVDRGMTNDPAWWEGALSPWPCEFRLEPAVPLMPHGPEGEPPKFKPSMHCRKDDAMCVDPWPCQVHDRQPHERE